MIFQTFLRDKDGSGGDPPKDPPLDPPKKPDAGPQGGDPPDPPKPDAEPDKGLSDGEKVELENLRKDKETFDKRLSDTQREYHTSRDELKGLKEKVDRLAKPPDQKPEDAYADDPKIVALDQKIKAYNERGYDISSLDGLKDVRVRELNLEKRLAGLESRNVQSDEVGEFLMGNPGVKDLTNAGETKEKLKAKGEEVSIDTAYHYNRGKNFDQAVKDEVGKQLEALKKGDGARSQDGGSIETPPEPDKEMQAYGDFLTNPEGDAAIK